MTVGFLLVMIVLGSAWLLIVYNRITNLTSLAREHQLSAEKKSCIRRRLAMISGSGLSGNETEMMAERINNIDHQIATELHQYRKVLQERQEFCNLIWVKPAVFMMEKNQTE